MKRKSLLFLMCFLALVGVAKAQLTLTVNDGTTTNEYVPIYGYYVDDYLRCQYVQPATDLSQMTSGTINSLTFYLSSPASASWGSANFQVYLKEVESTTISAFIDPATATTVYNGSLDGTQSTMTVTFDTPYTYTGGNLLIGFDNTVEGSWKRAYFYGVTATNACVQGYSSSSPSAVSPTQRNFLPKMDITYLPGDADPVVVESIEADDVTVGTGHTAQINYTVLPADAWYKQVSFASANNGIATVNQDGLVTAVAVGETTITITSVEYPTISTTINVTVEQTYEITIGEGISTSADLPLNMYYNYSLTEQLYTAEEIGVGACNINSVAFKLVEGTASKTYALDVYMMNTDKTTITNEDFVNVTSDDLVFSGNVNFTTGDWTTIQFTTPFAYTGGNVLLVVDNNTGDYDGYSRNFAVFSATEQAIYQRNDGTNYDPTNISNISSSPSKNQVIFGYSPIIVTPVESITADDITMMTGETAQITPTVLPADANQAVTYASANTSIATVSEDGLVTAVAAGTTTITITSVSTPEVSTIINVTVTSNPDNVIFSIEAPANAQPGDEIEAAVVVTGEYAAASLGIRFTYDSTVFVYQGRTQSGYIAEAVENGAINTFTFHPNASGDLHTEPGEVLYSVISLGDPFYYDGTLVTIKLKVKADASLGTTSTLNVGEAGETFVDNGQVHITNEPGYADVFIGQGIPMAITGYGTGDGNYYLLSSPIGAVNPVDVENMLDENGDYDLYYFDQSGVDDGVALEWRNYKPQHFDLEVGKGYLYASKEDVTLMFYGAAYTGDGEVSLDYDADAANFAGWNLVGNPYNQNATIDREFYVMNSDGTEIMPAEQDGIEPMQGVFVVADGENQTVTFTPGESKKMASLSLNLSNGRSLIDRAIVRFGEDRQLPKFQMNENSTKVYVPMNGNDYAVVHSEGMGEMPVNFKASKNGSYTLYAQMIEMDLAYLHLIDNFTGADVDLLVTPSYTFNATISDNANRFRLVFGSNNVADTNAESFAYLNNGNLIIEGVQGEATLELVDMLGRVLRTENFNGSYSTRVAESEGVYFVRLIQGNEVKTQKIVF